MLINARVGLGYAQRSLPNSLSQTSELGRRRGGAASGQSFALHPVAVAVDITVDHHCEAQVGLDSSGIKVDYPPEL